MLAGQGGVDHPCSEGGGCQENDGDADGGGDEEGRGSPVDGVLGRPMLCKERRVPHRVTKSENFPDSKIFVAKTFRIARKSHQFSNSRQMRIKGGFARFCA